MSPEFNVLPVPAGEILSRWSSDEGLRELSRVNNKRFHRSNVLGRVAHLLRLRGGSSKKGREIDKGGGGPGGQSVVLVPTYYLPGLLRISRHLQQRKDLLIHQTNATLL